MSKLQNIKAIKQMIDGTHKFQTKKTFGFTPSSESKKKTREIGEIWEEKDALGNSLGWYEQKQGYRIHYNVHPDLSKEFEKIRNERHSFPNCQKETCTCVKPTRLDEKFRRLMGMCHDCLVTMETKMKIEGKFGEYALEKMRQNALKFFQEKDAEFEEVKKMITNPITFVDGVDAIPETWSSDNPDELISAIETNYKKYKEQILSKFEES